MPKYTVSEELVVLADNNRPGVILAISVSKFPLQYLYLDWQGIIGC